MSDLAATQRRLRRLLTAPSGVRAALAEAGDADGTSLRGLVSGDARVCALDRLEVYANAYFHRIHDALAEDYGALAAALGSAGFHDLVTAYLCVHPPRRPSLRHAGEHLPRFLERDPVAGGLRRRWPWAPDLARLEWALVDAFDARDAALLTREDLAAIPPPDWQGIRLHLHASVTLVRVTFPVQRLRARYEADPHAVGAPGAPEAGLVLVWRQAERVLFRALGPQEAALLERARDGARFGALCAQLARAGGEADAPARAASYLAAWVAAGLLVRGAARGD